MNTKLVNWNMFRERCERLSDRRGGEMLGDYSCCRSWGGNRAQWTVISPSSGLVLNYLLLYYFRFTLYTTCKNSCFDSLLHIIYFYILSQSIIYFLHDRLGSHWQQWGAVSVSEAGVSHLQQDHGLQLLLYLLAADQCGTWGPGPLWGRLRSDWEI